MKRRWPRVVLGIAAVIAAAVLGVIHHIRAKLQGPPPPVCHAPALERRTFGPPQQVSLHADGTFDIEPGAALLPTGDVVAVYNRRTGLFSDSWLVSALLRGDGGVVTTDLPRAKSEYFDTWEATGGDGVVRDVWLGHNGGDPERSMEVGYSETRDGIAWSPGRRVDDIGQDCPNDMRGCLDKPMIAAVGSRVVVIYYSEAKGTLRARFSSDGAQTFGPSSGIENGDAYANVAVTPSGAVYVVNQTSKPGVSGKIDRFGDTRHDVELAVSVDGGPFGKPIRASADEDRIPFYFSNPQVAVDEARGFIYVAYPAGPDLAWNLWLATSHDQGQTWTRRQVNDDAPCANHMAPQVALDVQTGRLHLTWLENRSGAGVVAYSACEAGGRSCTPNEALSSPFASYALARHTPEWLGEYGALLIDPARRRLHSVWTQTVDEDGQPTARIFHASAPLAP